jgi:hypothetical protein
MESSAQSRFAAHYLQLQGEMLMERIRDLAQRGSETEAGGPGRGTAKNKAKPNRRMPRVAFALIVLSVGGYSPMLSGTARAQYRQGAASDPMTTTTTQTTPPPLVQNCWVLDNASPRQWACDDGKTYNSFKLQKMREDWEKDHPGSRAWWWPFS